MPMVNVRCGIIVVIYLCWPWQVHTQCETDVVLTSQAAITDFISSLGECDTLTGDLTIRGDSILSLKSFSKVKMIFGTLTIDHCDSLESLTGFDSLQSIEGSLLILSNPLLANLHGLNNITFIGQHLRIEGNTKLSNIRELANLASIGRDLRVVANLNLEDFRGLERIKRIGGSIDLDNNSALTSFRGLDQLEEIGQNLYIYRQHALQDLKGLELLSQIGGEFDVAENAVLLNLDALASLVSIQNCLYIFGNESLYSIEGLTSLMELGNTITVIRNPLLDRCAVEGLCNYLQDPPGAVSIWENGKGCSSSDGFKEACTVTSAPDEILDLNIHVFPNPTKEFLIVRGRSNTKYDAVLFDQFGRQLLEVEFLTQESLDLSSLLPGPYFLRIQSGDHFRTARLIKVP